MNEMADSLGVLAPKKTPTRNRGKCKELAVRVYFTFGGYMDGFIPNDLLRFNPTAVVIQAPREPHEHRRKSYTFEKGCVKRMEVKALA